MIYNCPEIINQWLKYSKYDPDAKSWKYGTIQFDTKTGNSLLQHITDTYDKSGILSVLYAKSMFIDWIKSNTTTYFDIFNNPEKFKEDQNMWNMFNGEYILHFEEHMLNQIDLLIDKNISVKQLGDKDNQYNRDILLNSLSTVIDSLEKCRYDCFLNSGNRIENINHVNSNIQLFENIAQCVLTLENARDGMYLCYIDNDHRNTGFFAFFIKNNGNIISVNERIVERYAGQNKKHRNGRFTEGKLDKLFPYDHIFDYSDYDYKGYAQNYQINEDKLNFLDMDATVYLPLLLAMICLKQKFENTLVSDHLNKDMKDVYIDALMNVNINAITEKSNALILQSSNIVKRTRAIDINLTTQDILNNSKGLEFTYEPEKNLKNWEEYGNFYGYNQILVDTYGDGFELDVSTLLKQNQHLKLLTGDELKDKNKDKTTNDMLIGSEKFIQLNAYYEARKQLADYIQSKINKEYDTFIKNVAFLGSTSLGLTHWWLDVVNENISPIERLISKLEVNGEFDKNIRYTSDDKSYKITKYDSKIIKEYFNTPKVINSDKDTYDGHKYVDMETGSPVQIYYVFEIINWTGFNQVLPNMKVPKILLGYHNSDWDARPYIGNSILEVVDPVSKLVTPFEHSYDYMSNYARYNFDFTVGYSKRGLQHKIKQYKESEVIKN
jgi:hypothetical protein